MSIQLIVLAELLNTLFIFLAQFEHSLGPLNMQLKDTQRQGEAFFYLYNVKQITPENPILNNQFNIIINSINEKNQKEMWENRKDNWKRN